MNLPPLPTFTGTNYDDWSIQMQSHLDLDDLWEVVEAPFSTLIITTKDEKVKFNSTKFWYKKDHLVKLKIQASVTTDMLPTIKSCPFANAIWSTLASTFNSNKTSHALELYQQLFNLCQDNETPIQMANKVWQLYEPQQSSLALKASTQKENPTETWYINSGVSSHFCPYLELFEEFKPLKTSITITNNNTVPVLGQAFLAMDGPQSYSLAMKDQFHKEWQLAIDLELKSMAENEVWDL
ncbi:hypothetical protein H4R33_006959, partial [Dimargaris cristalligena]